MQLTKRDAEKIIAPEIEKISYRWYNEERSLEPTLLQDIRHWKMLIYNTVANQIPQVYFLSENGVDDFT